MPTKTLRPPSDDEADAFAAFPDRGERHPGVLMYPDARSGARHRPGWPERVDAFTGDVRPTWDHR